VTKIKKTFVNVIFKYDLVANLQVSLSVKKILKIG